MKDIFKGLFKMKLLKCTEFFLYSSIMYLTNIIVEMCAQGEV